MKHLRNLIADDAHACTFQSMGQYRTALLNALDAERLSPSLPELNDDLIEILGRPNFACAQIAEVLRHSGIEIKPKAEHEQAAVLHYMLGLYLLHGTDWWLKVREDLEARAAAIKERKPA